MLYGVEYGIYIEVIARRFAHLRTLYHFHFKPAVKREARQFASGIGKRYLTHLYFRYGKFGYELICVYYSAHAVCVDFEFFYYARKIYGKHLGYYVGYLIALFRICGSIAVHRAYECLYIGNGLFYVAVDVHIALCAQQVGYGYVRRAVFACVIVIVYACGEQFPAAFRKFYARACS